MVKVRRLKVPVFYIDLFLRTNVFGGKYFFSNFEVKQIKQ